MPVHRQRVGENLRERGRELYRKRKRELLRKREVESEWERERESCWERESERVSEKVRTMSQGAFFSEVNVDHGGPNHDFFCFHPWSFEIVQTFGNPNENKSISK
jgi:hypothetical protein